MYFTNGPVRSSPKLAGTGTFASFWVSCWVSLSSLTGASSHPRGEHRGHWAPCPRSTLFPTRSRRVVTDNLAAPSGTFDLGGDLPVVRLGYGTMQLPGEGVWGPPRDHDEAVRVLRRAVEIGITFFDTADSYGPYVAEDLLREALHPYADDVVIATKAGLTRQGPGEWTPLGQPA
ncbi:MAG: aldo/keto reductase, partial [Marmoricola sp.]|nr:aldo/keto reductase [Marmoricola sp.]